MRQRSSGTSRNGLPYNRMGHGPRPLVILQGLLFENKPLPEALAWLYSGYYRYLAEDYATTIVLRRRGLPAGYSLKDMADDYAAMIREEYGGAVDVMGVSTGGSIAHHLAADHPDLVRRLVIHSSAYTLSDSSRALQLRVATLARQRRWREAYATMLSPTRYPRAVVWLGSLLAGALGAPQDPSDLVVTIEAEDRFDFRERLAEITAPTLVVAGEEDPYYPVSLFRETAEGIPGARLILYPGVGHPAGGQQFQRDVLAFLREGG
jgi:pimeloyl-ACP methyl ester carboxylesterase